MRRSDLDLAIARRDIVVVVAAVVVVVVILIVHLLVSVGSVHRLARRFLFRAPPRSVNVDDRQRVRRTIRVQHHRGLMRVLSQVEFQRVAIFSGVSTIGASVLINVRMRFEVAVQHRFVHARVRAFLAFERFRAEMIPQVIFQMVLVLGYEGAFRAGQQLFRLDVVPAVIPKLELRDSDEVALLAPERFHFPLGIQSWYPETWLVRLLRFLLRGTFPLIVGRQSATFILDHGRLMIVRRLRGIRRIVIRRAPILPWKLHSANRYNIFLVHPVEKKKRKGEEITRKLPSSGSSSVRNLGKA